MAGRTISDPLTPELRAAVQAGKLEHACPRCGRWEAATYRCSFCGRPVDPLTEWYRNGDLERRYRDFPATPPDPVPPEYMGNANQWPEQWGEYPRQRAPRDRTTPLNPARARTSRVSRPAIRNSVPPSTNRPASAAGYDGTLGLI